MTLSTEKTTQQCPERLRVFVVGNDTAFLDPIRNECIRHNYEVAIFSTISFPCNILKKANDCVDIIIIDAQMQDPNSYGFVEYVKQLNEFPLCMMSDDLSNDAMSKAFENGADAIWGKPFDEKHILQMRSEILRKKAEIKKKTSNVKEVPLKKRGRDNIKKAPIVTNGWVVDKDNNHNHQQKKKFEWTTERDEQFVNAVNKIGLDKAKPKKIGELMNVPGLTPAIVSSYLQRYKNKPKLNEGREVDHSMSEESNDNQDTNTAGVSVEVAPQPLAFFNLSKSAEPQLGLKAAHPIPEDLLNVTLDSVNQCDNNPKDTVVSVSNVPLEYPNLLPSSSQSLQPTLEAVHSNQEQDLNVQQCDNNVGAKQCDKRFFGLSLSSLSPPDNNYHASLANAFHYYQEYTYEELMSNQPNQL